MRESSSWSMGLSSFSAAVTKLSAHGTGGPGLERDTLDKAIQRPGAGLSLPLTHECSSHAESISLLFRVKCGHWPRANLSCGFRFPLISVTSLLLVLYRHPWIHLSNGCPVILFSTPNPSSKTTCRKYFIWVFPWMCKWLTSFSMSTLHWCICIWIDGKFKPRISQQVAKV